jgi:hypothetical protein
MMEIPETGLRLMLQGPSAYGDGVALVGMMGIPETGLRLDAVLDLRFLSQRGGELNL